jgi:hypothetical protein
MKKGWSSKDKLHPVVLQEPRGPKGPKGGRYIPVYKTGEMRGVPGYGTIRAGRLTLTVTIVTSHLGNLGLGRPFSIVGAAVTQMTTNNGKKGKKGKKRGKWDKGVPVNPVYI